MICFEMRLEGGPRPAASSRSSVRIDAPMAAATSVRLSSRSDVSLVLSTNRISPECRTPEVAAGVVCSTVCAGGQRAPLTYDAAF